MKRGNEHESETDRARLNERFNHFDLPEDLEYTMCLFMESNAKMESNRRVTIIISVLI